MSLTELRKLAAAEQELEALKEKFRIIDEMNTQLREQNTAVDAACAAFEKELTECKAAYASQFNELHRLKQTVTAAQSAPNPHLKAWQPIEKAPKNSRKMIVAQAFNVDPTGKGFGNYTSDPYCVWAEQEGFARWPHYYPPTHFFELPPNPV